MYQFVSIPKNASMSVHAALTPGRLPNNHKAAHKFEDKSRLFAVIRHPYDRFVSWYEYHKHNQNNALYKQLSFRTWMMMGCPVHWPDGLCKKLGVSSPLRQKEFITDPVSGEVLTEFVLRYSHLHHDIRREFGVGNALRLQTINKTQDRDKYQSYYTKEIKQAVEYYFSAELPFYNKLTQQIINEKLLSKG